MDAPKRKYEGYHADHQLPIQPWQVVTILKGTLIRTSGQVSVQYAKRTYKVRVTHILPGVTVSERACRRDRGETPGPKVPPKVCWVGKSGFWHEADINDIPEAQ